MNVHYCNFKDKDNQLHASKHMHGVKCLFQCAQLLLPQLLLLFILQKKDKQKFMSK